MVSLSGALQVELLVWPCGDLGEAAQAGAKLFFNKRLALAEIWPWLTAVCGGCGAW